MRYFAGFVLSILLLLPSPAKSQDTTSFVTLYAHATLPLGAFGDDTGSRAGLAKKGYGGGIEFSIPSGFNFMHYLLSAHIFVNGYDDSKLNSMVGRIFPGFNLKFEAGNWINIPMMAGLQIDSELSSAYRLIASGKIGLNIVKAPSFEMTIEGVSTEYTFKTSTAFGFAFSGGIVINDWFTIGLTYLGSDEPEFNGELKVLGQTEKLNPFSQSISLVLLSAGLIL